MQSNLKKLENENCKIYGDNILRKYYKGKVYPAKEKDWSTEYLTATVSVKVVKNSRGSHQSYKQIWNHAY